MKKTLIKSSLLLMLSLGSQLAAQEETHGPNFEGGIKAFRDLVVSKVDAQKIQSSYYCELQFTVDIDGSMTDIESFGNDNEFNLKILSKANNIKQKWTPASINGKPMRTRFKMPIRMDFE